MYMRLVQVKMNTEALSQLRQLYDERVIPGLRNIKGCLHVSLLQSSHHPEDCVSMTLWDNRDNADAYESSGAFSKFVAEATPYFAGSSEWNFHLSSDLTLQYDPVPEEPIVQAFDLPAQNNSSSILPRVSSSSAYIRIVTPQIRHGKMEEFKELFTDEILPALRSVNGCLHASLIENVKQKDQVFSLTVWDNIQHAEDYERSGLFVTLTKKMEPCFSDVFQWKKQLEKETHRRTVTNEEMTVDGFQVITGKSFL